MQRGPGEPKLMAAIMNGTAFFLVFTMPQWLFISFQIAVFNLDKIKPGFLATSLNIY